MTVFDASLRARFVDNGLHGEWIKHYVQGYRAPFKASPVNNRQRFETDIEPRTGNKQEHGPQYTALPSPETTENRHMRLGAMRSGGRGRRFESSLPDAIS